MKHFYLLSLLAALFCGNALLQAAPSAAADTLNHYVIDNQSLKQFDGSQLVGKKIITYQITTVVNGKDVIKIHDIHTESGQQTAQVTTLHDPAYVVDGKQVSKAEFEKLNPAAIKSINVIKGGSQEEVKKYPGWENGVILVETKKDGTPVFSTEESASPKIIIRSTKKD